MEPVGRASEAARTGATHAPNGGREAEEMLERRMDGTVPGGRDLRKPALDGFGDYTLQLVLNALAAVAIGVAAALALTP